MSTIKVTDLKLHFNLHNAESIGAADSHRVFGGDENQALREGHDELNKMLKEVFIKESDSQVLLWAYSQTSIKIKLHINKLVKFIELMTVATLVNGS